MADKLYGLTEADRRLLDRLARKVGGAGGSARPLPTRRRNRGSGGGSVDVQTVFINQGTNGAEWLPDASAQPDNVQALTERTHRVWAAAPGPNTGEEVPTWTGDNTGDGKIPISLKITKQITLSASDGTKALTGQAVGGVLMLLDCEEIDFVEPIAP